MLLDYAIIERIFVYKFQVFLKFLYLFYNLVQRLHPLVCIEREHQHNGVLVKYGNDHPGFFFLELLFLGIFPLILLLVLDQNPLIIDNNK